MESGVFLCTALEAAGSDLVPGTALAAAAAAAMAAAADIAEAGIPRETCSASILETTYSDTCHTGAAQ